jgi:hypothetical protein
MKVHFKVSMSGPNFTAHPGDVLDVSVFFSPDEVARMISKGVCEPIAPKVETATTRKAAPSVKTTRSPKK